jgi:arylsulfatase A-like enzyme
VRPCRARALPLLLPIVAACSGGAPEPEPPRPPNIVYVLADDLRYGEGAYGQEIIETPNLDALAREGMRFTRHYAGAPVCAPYWEFPSYGGQQAVRLERFKGIRRDMLEGETALQLFDLESDPREEHDVADAHPGVVAEIEAILEREHTPSPIERFRFPVLGEE